MGSRPGHRPVCADDMPPTFPCQAPVSTPFKRMSSNSSASLRIASTSRSSICKQLCKKKAGALGQHRHESRPPFLMLGVKSYDRLCVNVSALHLDGHRFRQLERDRSLGSELDVLLSG